MEQWFSREWISGNKDSDPWETGNKMSSVTAQVMLQESFQAQMQERGTPAEAGRFPEEKTEKREKWR